MGLAFESARGGAVLFGGDSTGGLLGDTWEYGGTDPGTYTTLGVGCAGWAGVPYPTALGRTPMLGEFFALHVGNLPPDHAALMMARPGPW